MSFAINPSLNHIDINEKYITEIYRSKGEVQLQDARFRGHPCEAYICISLVEKTMKAYVALIEMGINSVFVYTSDYSADNSADYPKVLAEADEFVRSMNFSMEKVNLEFSPAMREVIIKGLRVMRPPKKRPVLRSSTPYSEPSLVLSVPLPSAVPYKADISSFRQDITSAELETLQNELSSARAALEKITREKITLETAASREIATLKLSLNKATELKRLSDEKLVNAVKQEIYAAAIRKQEDLVAAMRGEQDAASQKAELVEEAHQARISALEERIVTLEHQNLHLQDQLLAEKSSSAEKIAQLASEKDSFCALLQAEKTAADDKIAALTLFENSWREGQQREEELCQNIGLMRTEISRLETEVDNCRGRDSGETGSALKITALEKALATSEAEIERLRSSTLDRESVQAEIKGYAEAQKDVEAEYIRLATESMEKEAELLDALYAADTEIIRLSRELEVRSQVAEMEKTALRGELNRLLLSGAKPAAAPGRPEEVPPVPAVALPLAVEKITPSQPLPELRAETAATLSAEASDDDIADTPVAGDPEISQALTNEFGNFSGSSSLSTTEFVIDPDMSMIEYSDPAEIVAILSSSNTVQAVLPGKNTQRCKGYIIAAKKEGEYRTYVAWYLTESKQVVICTPEQQPVDSMECTQILQDAIAYFEIVGFMMELEDLGGSVKSYNKVIRKVPALKRK